MEAGAGFEICHQIRLLLLMTHLVSLTCAHCKTKFERKSFLHDRNMRRGTTNVFCSAACHAAEGREYVTCKNCNKQFTDRREAGRKFCSKSCAAVYNNRHKKHGTRRSKLETWLEQQLTAAYPDMCIVYNSCSAIDGELDIYIPDLKLAFELNGIFHYEPVFGDSKLSQIQSRDANKFQKCQLAGISLCIIDVSAQISFSPKSSEKYLSIIHSIIEQAGQAVRENGSGDGTRIP